MTESASTLTDHAGRWPAARRAWYVAAVLMTANTLAFVDRQVLALLVQPIQDDLGISDTAISLLYGISFTLFYVAVGIPIARLADRTNRRNIIAVSVVAWSAMTVACGLARSFPALLLARIGVGAGEGGLTPSAYSILADYFPKDRLAAAMGVYHAGIYLGGAAALLLAGFISSVISPDATVVLPLLGAVRGWQVVFLLLGVPGLLLTALVMTVREPARRGSSRDAGERVALGAVAGHIRGRWRAYSGIMFGFGLMVLVGAGAGAWVPTFLQRKFGWSTAEIGAAYGMVFFFCGSSGALAGGFFASWLRGRGVRRANLLAALGGFCALLPLTISFPLVPTAGLALALIGAMNFFAGFNFGGGLAALQDLTPNRMRALVSSAYLLVINLVGAGLGPTAVALITDYGFADPQRLPEALAITAAVASPLAILALLVALTDYRPVEDSAG